MDSGPLIGLVKSLNAKAHKKLIILVEQNLKSAQYSCLGKVAHNICLFDIYKKLFYC